MVGWLLPIRVHVPTIPTHNSPYRVEQSWTSEHIWTYLNHIWSVFETKQKQFINLTKENSCHPVVICLVLPLPSWLPWNCRNAWMAKWISSILCRSLRSSRATCAMLWFCDADGDVGLASQDLPHWLYMGPHILLYSFGICWFMVDDH